MKTASVLSSAAAAVMQHFRLAICHSCLQASAERSVGSLKEQLAGMLEVHRQLEEAGKALQGKVELREQEIEVLNMEILAKDKVAALHQAIRDQMALQMPLPQVRLPLVLLHIIVCNLSGCCSLFRNVCRNCGVRCLRFHNTSGYKTCGPVSVGNLCKGVDLSMALRLTAQIRLPQQHQEGL